MLKIINIESRSQIDAIFSDFNSDQATWLVSDLRTKFELQESILTDVGYFCDESVFRASDLWKLLLKRTEPRLRIVSDSFIRSLIRAILDSDSEALGGVTASAEETIFAYLDQMASIVFHPEGSKMLSAWFEEHPESEKRWKEWFLRARWVGVKLINEYQVISQRWIASWLQNDLKFDGVWQRPLVVDLGGELSRTEAELLRALSRSVDVTILRPQPSWHQEFHYLLQPYQWLESQAQTVVSAPKVDTSVSHGTKTLRLSGMLAEVKEATSKVREWLDQGISARKILVTAPDIEAYWSVLEPYFSVEGIPMNKAQAGKLQSLPSVTKWLAQLRVRSQRLSSTDLELSFYGSEKSQGLRFEKFKSLYNSLYVESDLDRHALLKETFAGKFDIKKSLHRDEFVAQALLYWTSSETEHVQTILRELLTNADSIVKLSWKEWLKYLESIVALKEWTIKKANMNGVTITKLMSAGSSRFTHRIFLGLTEDFLKSKSKLQLSGPEYFALAKDLGFVLNNPDFSDLDFEIRWISDIPALESQFCVGLSDFSGKLQTPSMYWLSEHQKSSGDQHDLHIPKACRWDELQSGAIKLNERLEQDLGLMESTPFPLPRTISLSPSGIESYQECPFVFAASRVFRLEDHPDVELDVDPRTKGNLAHGIFEALLAIPLNLDRTDEELEAIVEKVKQDSQLVFAAPELWIPIKRRHIQLAKRFLDFERALRTQFPKTQTVAMEKELKAWFDLETEKFTLAPTENSVPISGRLDRLDSDGQQMVIYDYKSSAGSSPSTTKWIDDCHLQMPFYMWVIENSQKEYQGSVDAALYYIFKDFQLKGFAVNERAGSVYNEIRTTARNVVQNDESGKVLLLEAFEKLAAEKIKLVAEGLFAPKPAKPQDCPQCKWRRLCRAPHLN